MNVAVYTMAEMQSQEKSPEIVFWVGCMGSFDARAQKVTKAFAQILNKLEIPFAILGQEEQCSGDPVRRAGNEFVFQMLAIQNIQTLNLYKVERIVATCPHCFNTLKNEYPELGGKYEVIHHTQYLNELMDSGRLKFSGGAFQGKKIAYHDSCYLGRINNEYEAPRSLLKAMDLDLAELKRSRTKGLCCGAGGAQMFKEDEDGKERINMARTEEFLEADADIIAVNCPFCLTMFRDGVTAKEREDVMVLDLSEMIIQDLKQTI